MTALASRTVFVYPVPIYKDGRQPKISSGYRTSDRPNHNGVDIMYPRQPSDGGKPGYDLPDFSTKHYMPGDVPALAYGPGKVTTSKEIGTGGYVVIDHPLGWRSQYMHLSKRKVRVGQSVDAGQPIGIIGHGKEFPLNHLHFQLRYNGNLANPASYLKNAPMLPFPSSVMGYLLAVGAVIGGFWLYKRYA